MKRRNAPCADVKIKLGVLLMKINPRNDSALEKEINVKIYMHTYPFTAISQSATGCKTIRRDETDTEAPMPSSRHIRW